MRIDPTLAKRISAESHLRGRQQECFELLAAGLSEEQIALGVGVSLETVRVHLHRARRKIQKSQSGWSSARDWWTFIIHEAMAGPQNPSPPTPLYVERGPCYGQRARLHGSPPVTVDDLLGL